MEENFAKRTIRNLLFPDGAIRPILFGPLRGRRFRVGPVTGLSPIYSGVERHNQILFQQHIRPGDTVLDVGANWGIHTLLFAQLVGPRGKVFAFEPYPPAFSELKFHTKINRLAAVECIPLGVSNKAGEAAFGVAPSAAMGSLASDRWPVGYALEQIKIETTTIDDFCASRNLSRLDFIKIDIEGADHLAIQGAAKSIARFRPKILVDVGGSPSDQLCREILEGWGYTASSEITSGVLSVLYLSN